MVRRRLNRCLRARNAISRRVSPRSDTTVADGALYEDAPAKINLFLHVGSRADSGYHPLESLVVFADFGDRLRLSHADGFALERSGPFAHLLPKTSDDDLTARAVAGVAEIYAREPDVAIALEKNIPVAAGLGGGSADAAAAIRLVCRAWSVPHNSPEVCSLAARLGADVPMCLESAPAWVAGIGERITLLRDVASLHLLLVNPRAPLSAADVFDAFDAPSRLEGDVEALANKAGPASLVPYLTGLRNDLDAPARALRPIIAEVQAALESIDGCHLARMSGSGPTCFGVFNSPDACARGAEMIATLHPDWWVQTARTRTGL